MTFAVIGIAMIVAAVAAALVFTGIVPVPFGNDFSVKVKYAETGDIPCPTADAKPVAPSQVTVTVINTTQHQGLASKATDMLQTAGFQTEEPSNSDVEYTGRVRITAGVNSVDAAYSVARFFPGSHVRCQGTCTGHNVVVTGREHIQPTKIATFPLYKAKKSPFQQHVAP